MSWSQQKVLPNYQSFTIDVDQECDINSIFKNSVHHIINDGLILGQQYNIEDGKYTIFLNNNTNKITEAQIEQTREISRDGELSIIETVEPLVSASIVLFDDISFINIEQGFQKDENVNIIGNNYYISYYGSALFNRMSGEGSFIKDVKLLSENYNGAMIYSGTTMQAVLNNVSLYGSVVGLKSNIGAIINYAGGSTVLKQNITSFASITAERLSDYNIELVSNNMNVIFTNYGFIESANGDDGLNGITYDTWSTNGGNGYAGEAGKDVVITKGSDSTFNNNGVVKAGDGGNGGAGGSGTRAQDYPSSISVPEDDIKPGTAGVGGTGGNRGNIGLGSDLTPCALSKNGIAGLKGATGRYSVGGISLYTNQDGGVTNVLNWWTMGMVRTVGTNEIHRLQLRIDPDFPLMFDIGEEGVQMPEYLVFNEPEYIASLFGATGDYDAQFPTDWVNQTYEQLLNKANEITGT